MARHRSHLARPEWEPGRERVGGRVGLRVVRRERAAGERGGEELEATSDITLQYVN